MFLKKITKIQTVGRFRTANIRGGEYGNLTLFYGGNGRGKTTICAILRSLQQADSKFVVERKTFGSTDDQEIELILDSGPSRFSKGAWTSTDGNVHIFDGHFVNENVHGGHNVGTDHRRNFYQIVVGEKGVQLAKDLKSLDESAALKLKASNTQKKVIESHVPQELKFEDFVSLKTDPDLEGKLTTARTRMKAANNAEEIGGRKLVEIPELPTLPDDYESVLSKTLENVSAGALEKTSAQIEKHGMSDKGDAWLAYGLSHTNDNDCAFCGQEISGNELLDAYRDYFSKDYEQLKVEIGALKDAIQESLSDARGARITSSFRSLAGELEFWKKYGPLEFSLPPEIDEIETRLAELRRVTVERVASKISAPLDTVQEGKAHADAVLAWIKLLTSLSEWSERWEAEVTPVIKKLKEDAASVEVKEIEAEILRLNAIEKRYDPVVSKSVEEYEELLREKKEVETKRTETKTKLDAYDEKIFNDWEKALNRYLTSFGASFRLVNAKKNYVGKTPQCVYGIEFTDGSIDVAAKETVSAPSFRTAMSAGDKNTLALAFFLTQLERDDAIGDKLVIFDDPFTSLDEFRRAFTAKTISRLVDTAAQIIVLSHDKHFLKASFDHAVGITPCTKQLSLNQNNVSIEDWDIEREVKEGYLQDHMAMVEFSEGANNDARAMRTLMRPLLEKYIRYRFPNKIPDGTWLGDMIAVIRADADHPLKAVLSDLEDINDYTAPFHHDPNTPFNDDEVRTYVDRTLEIVGGC